jgi:hypothetical protein
MPSVERSAVLYPALAIPFLSTEKCSTMLQNVRSETIQNQLEIFNACMKDIELKNIPARGVKGIIHALLVKVEKRKANKFRTLQENKNLVWLEDAGDINMILI